MKTITELEWRRLFSERVRHYMQLYDINQKELAESIGVTEAAISRYLSYERTPRIDVIVSLASVFACTTDELIMFGYVVMG